ncbi:MAG: hypothetical protein A2798_01430 [Candidatus Levybacteria bacterium RIFCSPHIGHO2_01_FULL_37_17]|nr:MAG: hypothetical protein A2798_01430 [Candidatus Levybacteria bacterium RIFCSPHIGHO2_01_FULL_37_17]OGH37110.1 MAG: hypothetical protein A2959_02290 [Candidatus Levybacteria bacterium RIFCSPLOWO2_01_FULL_38_23]
MKKITVLLIGLFALLIISTFQNTNNRSSVVINETKFKAEFAITSKQKEIGLSKYDTIQDDFVMVFPFENNVKPIFWMKGMKFPIDIIFVNNSKIIQIFKNLPPPKSINDALPLYQPRLFSDTVIEVKAGVSDKNNFKEGDEVRIIK